jgi:hypothetical protein
MSENSQELSSQDLLNASILFSQALIHVLSDKQGIIVYIKPESGVQLSTGADKVVIFKIENSIHVQQYDGDIPEGTVVNLSDSDNGEENPQ